MRRARPERLLLTLALLCALVSAWQLLLHTGDNRFADGICAAVTRPGMPPAERAMQLFRWVSGYDDADGSLKPTPVVPPASGSLLTPRLMVEHRDYFRGNCGNKAWLLAVLARRSGLNARELRLCDANHLARHVVCEIWIEGDWRVFDPTSGLDFRRADGQLATAADLGDPVLLAQNAGRAPQYNPERWPFTHPERLHFERVPMIGAALRRVAPRVTGRPAEELAVPFVLKQPRLVAACGSGALGLFLLAATAHSTRRRGAAKRHAVRTAPHFGSLAIHTADQD